MRRTSATQLGMVLGALLATACCWVPLTIGLFGLTVLGLGATLDAWRPLFLGLTVIFMAWSFRVAFLRQRQPAAHAEGCEPDCSVEVDCAEGPRRTARVVFFAHAALVAAVLAAPLLIGSLPSAVASEGADSTAAEQVAEQTETVTLTVEGMTCQGCVRGVENVLRGHPGVQTATVTLRPGAAEVIFDPAQTNAAAIIATLAEAGFTADVVGIE